MSQYSFVLLLALTVFAMTLSFFQNTTRKDRDIPDFTKNSYESLKFLLLSRKIVHYIGCVIAITLLAGVGVFLKFFWPGLVSLTQNIQGKELASLIAEIPMIIATIPLFLFMGWCFFLLHGHKNEAELISLFARGAKMENDNDSLGAYFGKHRILWAPEWYISALIVRILVLFVLLRNGLLPFSLMVENMGWMYFDYIFWPLAALLGAFLFFYAYKDYRVREIPSMLRCQ